VRSWPASGNEPAARIGDAVSRCSPAGTSASVKDPDVAEDLEHFDPGPEEATVVGGAGAREPQPADDSGNDAGTGERHRRRAERSEKAERPDAGT
jgi:hypothetical protein